jgi:signal transduction histidine kinase
MWETIVLNLLSNAVKFSAADTPVHVHCLRDSSGGVRLSVVDRGIGMTPEEAQLAVRPFRQIDTRLARKYDGAGLGLSIVKKLIERHGGELVIESEPEVGSCISLVFPAAAVVAGAMPCGETAASPPMWQADTVAPGARHRLDAAPPR